jgi:hypothetical protein
MDTVSYAEFVKHAEGLIDAIDLSSPAQQAGLATEREELVEALAEMKALKTRQVELVAGRLETSQLLGAAIRRAKDAAMSVRAVAKGKLGPRNERLAHFGVAPVRQRSRKAPLATAKKKTYGATTGTTPGAVVSPDSNPVA